MLLRFPPSPALQCARQIAKTLAQAGFAAYFAGGCVRDVLLGQAATDFDIATSATPEQIQALFPRTLSVGAHFGVILVVEDIDGASVSTEVATFRHDGAYADGRRPDAVRFSLDPREDVLRRDFTVNGMLLDPAGMKADTGGGASVEDDAVRDFVGGRADLRAGLIRTIGPADVRFGEDKLRMLRGVRFAARLGFALEPATAQAIEQHASEIHLVSSERVRDELTRMLTEGHARRAVELLHATGLLAKILPEAVAMRGVEQPPDWHPEGDVWVHTMLLLDKLPAGAEATLAWGALLHDIGKPATFRRDETGRIRFNGHVEVGVRMSEDILKRLRFSGADTEQIVALVKNHMRFGDVPQMKESTLRRFLRLPRFPEHLALHWLDCTSCHGRLGIYEFVKERFERDPEVTEQPALLVTGRHLIQAGYLPGPKFKKMLEAAEDAQLEGSISTEEEGLRWIRRQFPQ